MAGASWPPRQHAAGRSRPLAGGVSKGDRKADSAAWARAPGGRERAGELYQTRGMMTFFCSRDAPWLAPPLHLAPRTAYPGWQAAAGWAWPVRGDGQCEGSLWVLLPFHCGTPHSRLSPRLDARSWPATATRLEEYVQGLMRLLGRLHGAAKPEALHRHVTAPPDAAVHPRPVDAHQEGLIC